MDVYTSRVKTAIRPIIAVGLAVGALGCGSHPRLYGTYEGVRNIQVAPGTARIVKAQLSLVRLIVKGDDTAYLSDGGIPFDGEIQYSGGHAEFVARSVAGAPVETEPAAVRASADAVLTPLPKGSWLYKGLIVLTPKPEPR